MSATDGTGNNTGPALAQDEGLAGEDPGFLEDASILTQSVRSSIYEFKVENGRRYHAYKEGKYFMPNDEREQDRLDMQHRANFLASGSKIIHAPVEDPQHILDLGTGTGIWAIEAADLYPTAEVIGVDLSPIQPSWVPPNVKFEVDDVEDDWTWPDNHFDVVHSQLMLVGSIKNYRRYFEQAFTHLKPGGYFDILEVTSDARSDHFDIPRDAPCVQWCHYMIEGIAKMGCSLDLNFEALADMMRDVGFVDVVLQPFKLPIGRWPADKTLKEVGAIQLVSMLEGMESLSLAIFTRCLGWSKEETDVLIANVRQDFLRKRWCLYWPAAVIYGRKPDYMKGTLDPS